MTLTVIAVLFAILVLAHLNLHRKVSTLQGIPVVKKVTSKGVVACPVCETSYTFKQCNIEKTGPNDKAIVVCRVCDSHIEVTFDAKGNAQCQV